MPPRLRQAIRRTAATLAFVAMVWLGLATAPARAGPVYPAFSGPVVDDAHILSAPDKAAITRKLFDLQLKTGVQFAVATIASLDGQEIEPYANGLFRDWKVGQKGVNNGLLLVLAPNERKLRFEVGYGLEGSFTDLQSKLILHNTMVPKLKAGDPSGALTAGVDDAITVLTSDKANLPERLKAAAPNDQTGNVFVIIFIVVVAFIVLTSLFRRRRGGFGGSWVPGGFIGGASGWSGGDNSSSGGDSFSGGGGGDSGGGGSSDSY